MATVTDKTPLDLLARFRGNVVDAVPAYPDSIHLGVVDANGGKWTFATFDADFSPSDPEVFRGKTVVSAELAPSHTLTIGFSDGTELVVAPRPLKPGEEDDDLENWFLHTPEEVALDFGPVGRWRFGSVHDPW